MKENKSGVDSSKIFTNLSITMWSVLISHIHTTIGSHAELRMHLNPYITHLQVYRDMKQNSVYSRAVFSGLFINVIRKGLRGSILYTGPDIFEQEFGYSREKSEVMANISSNIFNIITRTYAVGYIQSVQLDKKIASGNSFREKLSSMHTSLSKGFPHQVAADIWSIQTFYWIHNYYLNYLRKEKEKIGEHEKLSFSQAISMAYKVALPMSFVTSLGNLFSNMGRHRPCGTEALKINYLFKRIKETGDVKLVLKESFQIIRPFWKNVFNVPGLATSFINCGLASMVYLICRDELSIPSDVNKCFDNAMMPGKYFWSQKINNEREKIIKENNDISIK